MNTGHALDTTRIARPVSAALSTGERSGFKHHYHYEKKGNFCIFKKNIWSEKQYSLLTTLEYELKDHLRPCLLNENKNCIIFYTLHMINALIDTWGTRS